MAATVATVAYLGLEARAVEVQVQLSSGLPRIHHRRPARQGRGREPRAGPRGAWRRSAWRCRPRSSRSTCRPPICPRKARITICRSRCACWRRSARPTRETLSHYVAVGELSLDGRIAASPGVLLAALHASALDKGLICPAAQGSEAAWAGELEVIAAPDLLALLAHLQGHRAAVAAAGRPRPSRPTAAPISPRSRGRKSPSARSRSPRRAGTIC